MNAKTDGLPRRSTAHGFAIFDMEAVSCLSFPFFTSTEVSGELKKSTISDNGSLRAFDDFGS
uniref:Uncharacterized protein n=1 Tax=Romanomermis culicivorax TaxID=13658 RepID=A0A915KD96_ROMCU